MNRKQAMTVVATATLVLLAILSFAIAYYAFVAIQGNPGDALTDGLGVLLENESALLGPLAGLIVALPAVIVGKVTSEDGTFTRIGWVFLALLLITFAVSQVAGIALDPTEVALGDEQMPVRVDATALRLSTFSTTLLAGIFGLWKSGKPASEDPR